MSHFSVPLEPAKCDTCAIVSQLDLSLVGVNISVMDWNIFVSRRIPQAGLDLLRKSLTRVDVFDEDAPMDHARLIEEARDRNGLLIMGSDQIDAAVLGVSPRLRVVSNLSVGYNNIDVAEATRRKIIVTNTPGVLTDATADLTWALILAVARRVGEGERFARSGQWKGWAVTQLLGTDVTGKTLGIVGAGRIGTAVAKRACGFSMKIIYTARSDKPAMVALGAKRVSFDEVLSQSDFVCVHVPLTPETRHLFGEREFRKMKPTAYFINVARGPVHDEVALVRALQEGWITGAGLDVFENEPQIAPGLLTLPNVVVLPHLGTATVETRSRMAVLAVENLLSVLRGEQCENVVNPEALSR